MGLNISIDEFLNINPDSLVTVNRLSNLFEVKLNKAYDSVVEVMSLTTQLRDPFTFEHQNRVAKISVAIGKKLHWDIKKIKCLEMAAQIHDIGKICIPSEILNKPNKLSRNEDQLMQEHSDHGYQILKNVDFSWPLATIVRQHHERLDGTGYPDGLKGLSILEEARVIAIADTIEAMTTNRPYRIAPGLGQALSEIKKSSGIKFDKNFVAAMLDVFIDISSIEEII